MSIALFLEPLDTLFFRDNRPFSAGEDTFAESTLPSPLTVYGAIGSYILNKNSTDPVSFFKKTSEDPTLGLYDDVLTNTNLRLRGPFFVRDKLVYLPSPANLFRKSTTFISLPDLEAEPKWDIEDNSLKPMKLPPNEKAEPVKGFLPLRDIERYLKDDLISISPIESDNLFLPEARVGHKLNRDTLTVEEGFLYSAGHLRFEDYLSGREHKKTKIVVCVDGVDLDVFSDETIFLGGERRRVKIGAEEGNSFIPQSREVLSKIKENKQFFLYFVTPTIFKDGFARQSWPFDAELVGAAIDKPLYLSGWKRTALAKGHPRPLRKVAPAGSVYFFKADGWQDESFDELYGEYHFNKSLSEEYPCAGFGITLIGVW